MNALRILLLRHGQTASNAGNVIQGHLPVPLNETGFAQARALGARLAKEEKIELLVSSDLLRAAQTAEEISRAIKVPIQSDPRWRERFMGSAQGKSFDAKEIWRLASGHVGCDDAEPTDAMETRIYEAMMSLTTDFPGAKTIAVVTHGGPLRMIAKMLHTGRLPLSKGATPPTVDEIINCAINEMQFDGKGWRVTRINDASHLDGSTNQDAG